ncbi:MAG TPA: ECF-type sigma factor [Gemmataceae bacterium]|jgi:DNA-directed RNA polymerase specialized sigma24 family protein
MQSDGTITGWVSRLQAGDQAAAQPLWESYFERLVRLARGRLGAANRAAADEEDVALSAFNSFCRAAECGRFPQLRDRNDLWRLLILFTERKAINLLRAQHRHKRGAGRVFVESGAGLDGLPGREPTPEFAARVVEEHERLLGLLGNDILRRLAQLKLEGWANEEIAERLGCAVRTVERKLAMIRKSWEGELLR